MSETTCCYVNAVELEGCTMSDETAEKLAQLKAKWLERQESKSKSKEGNDDAR